VDLPIIIRLRNDGHEVHAIVEGPTGITDDEVLKLANSKGVVLLTGDKDFGELVYRDKRYNCGVVLMRLAGLENHQKAAVVAGVIKDHANELEKAFTVISPYKVRIRPRM
jgi:predicted nuclease of predicted toxin-antitoxin system